MANNKPTVVTTGEVRISYEHLVKPHTNSTKPGAEPKYSATLLISKSDIATKQRIDAAIEAAKQEGPGSKWGGVTPPIVPIPVHDGDGVRPSGGMPFGEECKGCWVMSASSKNKQDIVDLNLQPIMDATQIYSGMYARVNVNFFAYNQEGKKGIGCGLGPVQKTRDGEPLAGGVSAEEAFGDGFSVPQAAPGYSQPAYQQPPTQGYGAPMQPQYQQPYGVQPQTPPWHNPAQPAYPQQPACPQQPAQGYPQQGAVPGGYPAGGYPQQGAVMGV